MVTVRRVLKEIEDEREIRELKTALHCRDDFLVQNDLWQKYIQFTLKAHSIPNSALITKANELWGK